MINSFSLILISISLVLIVLSATFLTIYRHTKKDKKKQIIYILNGKVISEKEAKNYELVDYKTIDNIICMYYVVK